MEIDHIHAQIFSPFINNSVKIEYPFISLLASGGTTSLFKVSCPTKIEVLNSTNDDVSLDTMNEIYGYSVLSGLLIKGQSI